MNRKSFIAAIALCGLAIGVPASAQTAEAGPRADMFLKFVFAAADADDDGVLGPAEILNLRMRGFDRADTDGDGTISADEQAAALERGQRRATHALLAAESGFERFDTDGDGQVTRMEFENAPTPFFELIDANDDGSIDRQELARLSDIIGDRR
ncbi:MULTISPECIES: EF-hand domain-containing protein [unclassified Roseitalea]|uniref:EF-hand domain-containing protein n=1 Tax=unclassified Roseitalea TaxID=2639107 RepID=UPI00273DE2A6|nr:MULTISPECIES: EF-hand domain-containing protein [unclassified Roseitalea]